MKRIMVPERELRDMIKETISDFLKGYVLIPKIDVVHLHLNERLADGEGGFVLEAKTCFTPIPGTKYTYRQDKPNGEPRPGNLHHAHVYSKGKQIFAMNIDGTAHDGCHQVMIPDDVATFLRGKGYTIPPGNLIEVLTYSPGLELLLD